MSEPSTNQSVDDAVARRSASEEAVNLAVGGRWQEAASANRELLRRFGADAEVYNRLGKALAELGKISEAREAYEQGLAVDPTNAIARRNLERLAGAKESNGPPEPTAQMSRGLFIEDAGKAAVVQLQAAERGAVTKLDAGDPTKLEVRGNAVNAVTPNGDYLGMVEPRIGLRLARLIEGGNQYEAAFVSTEDPPRIIVREIFQHASQVGKVSFPKSNISDVRAYTRRNFMREDVDDLVEHEDDSGQEPAGDGDRPGEGWTEELVDDDGVVRPSRASVDDEDEELD